ncbi:MAG: branched chain amino acid aminotransferase, partial [Promicromonosporaceae bacterium]|nr:branched chain amino acid aminotransferase [Promicromonosporaceae bacterium]
MPITLAGAVLPESVERLISQFQVTPSVGPTPDAVREAEIANPRFGTVFTDHMVRISWTRAGGWSNQRVVPFESLTLSPASAVLHYGQEIFEGLKAYRHADGSIWSFRPGKNAKRFNKSADRLALPELPTDLFLASCAAMARIDRDWVPSGKDSTLYLRPFMFASEAFLGVRSANAAEFLVIASPAGAYFAG